MVILLLIDPCILSSVILTFCFRCDCTLGYRGKNCSELDFCVIGTCPSGSTCQSLLDGFECKLSYFLWHTRALDKKAYFMIIFLICHGNICCDPSSEPSCRDGSDEGSQHMFLCRINKNYA